MRHHNYTNNGTYPITPIANLSNRKKTEGQLTTTSDSDISALSHQYISRQSFRKLPLSECTYRLSVYRERNGMRDHCHCIIWFDSILYTIRTVFVLVTKIRDDWLLISSIRRGDKDNRKHSQTCRHSSHTNPTTSNREEDDNVALICGSESARQRKLSKK